MLDPKYEVTDNWQNYPSAVSVQQLLQAQEGIIAELEYEADSLIAQIALSVDKDISVPEHLSEKEFHLLYKIFHQAEKILNYLEGALKLSFDATFKDERFWLFDSSNQKLLTGFFHNLLINQENLLGVIIKHYWGKEHPISIVENKELQTLALIAMEAFNLKNVAVVSLWIFSDEPELHIYTTENLTSFKDGLQALLKQIH
jgi:hypothetical protein